MENPEEWRQVPGWPRYAVSSQGRLRAGDFVLKPVDSAGYPTYRLKDGSRGWFAKVHWLVAMAFIGPRPSKHQINHIDGDKQNNRVENLEYIPQAENIRHAFRTGLMPLGEDRRHSKLTNDQVREIRRLGALGVPQWQIGERFGIHQTHVGKILNRTIWKHVA